MLPELSRIFLLKRASKETLLSIALIVGALTSMMAFANGITARTEELGGTDTGSKAFLVVGGNTADCGFNDSTKRTVAFGKISTQGENIDAPVISTDLKYLERSGAELKGEMPRGDEAIVGDFLAETLGVQIGDGLVVRVNGKRLDLKIAGTVKSKTQTSTSLLVRENFFPRVGAGEKVGLTIVRPGEEEESAIKRLKDSQNLEVAPLGDVKGFIREVNQQAFSLISVWVLIGCVVVLVGSGVGAARLVEESGEELETLRSVGGGRKTSFLLMFLTVSVIAFSGSLLGVSLGIAGSQVVTTAAGWFTGGGILTPILDLHSVFEIFGLASVSAIGGGLISLANVMGGSET
ncbi:hypothetical protein AKJ41_02565 [candidate division MSBL1 archaeon SCGC-AAA259O05]|uniref:Uncharacterized protein n=1 Tax=candidate division MSBL1 archaeon SCGC-AAA259O05 TaxID=1698271 RepID=A0A133V3Y7_9EURY|nr:hypothetical protein AKJ41_02565 [candidate division MSBL1 archaeon SCGC-AAA259O05]